MLTTFLNKLCFYAEAMARSPLKSRVISNWPKTLVVDYHPSYWSQDPKGYFLIEVDHIKKRILVGFLSNKGEPQWKVAGKRPVELYYTILRAGAVSKMEHAAYLGEELAKAYIALTHGLKYVQDEDIDCKSVHVPREKDEALAKL
ncbi:DUF4346 domain-containing protein [Candidatus Woesearchaeota archaeon]|nr:MAG: DUF4346 domain-containing protein [Candidatus Woesearchaeota archaeon]